VNRVLAVLLAEADAAGLVDWTVAADSTHARAHRHATNTRRPGPGETSSAEVVSSAGGSLKKSVELRGSARRSS